MAAWLNELMQAIAASSAATADGIAQLLANSTSLSAKSSDAEATSLRKIQCGGPLSCAFGFEFGELLTRSVCKQRRRKCVDREISGDRVARYPPFSSTLRRTMQSRRVSVGRSSDLRPLQERKNSGPFSTLGSKTKNFWVQKTSFLDLGIESKSRNWFYWTTVFLWSPWNYAWIPKIPLKFVSLGRHIILTCFGPGHRRGLFDFRFFSTFDLGIDLP